jgi:NADH dehydrogenase
VIVVTGANGNLGKRLLKTLAARGQASRAVVRSARAAGEIEALSLGDAVDVQILDYLDGSAMETALRGADAVVHLVGIIKESASSRYADAHEGTTRVLAEAAAAAGVGRIIYLSIVGTAEDSSNSCLASKARGETLLRAGTVPTLVLRVPMVLGEGDYASAALKRRAMSSANVLLRASSLEQPIYAGDVIAAVLAALERPEPLGTTLDLAGPESLTRAELTRRAAASVGRRTRVLSLPLALGMLLARVLERLSPTPPVTRAMLGVLDHDDVVDNAPAVGTLRIELTPLDDALRLCLADPGAA